MFDQSLLKSSFLGRDGYRWWLGQVPPGSVPSNDTWGERVPVRILGYHTEDGAILPDDQLPLALISKPTTAGADNRQSSTIVGGEFVIGFFLDGDDAQQPVITGVIDKSVATNFETDSSTAFANKSTQFFSTNYYSDQTIPAWRVATALKNPDPSSVTDSGGGKSAKPSGKEASRNEAGDDTGAPIPSLADSDEIGALAREFAGPSNCGDSDVSRIQVELSKITAILEGVTKYYDLYVVQTINAITDVVGQIQQIIRNIAAVARTLVQRARNFLLKQIKNAISSIITAIFGDNFKDLADGIIAEVIDIIFCILQNTIESLPDLIGDFVAGIIGQFASTPVCAAEQFINALLNNVFSTLDDILSDVAKGLDSIFSSVLSVGSSILGAIDTVLGILGFLCLTKKCTEVDKFSASPWGGPSKSQKDNYSEFLSKFNVADISDDVVDWLDESGFTLDGDFGAGDCSKSANLCGPPTIDIFGGVPEIAASVKAVISDAGQIIGAVVKNGGRGYSSRPFVTFNDPCNTGVGAAAYAVMGPDDKGNPRGAVEKIIISHPGYGYIKYPNGKDSLSPIFSDPSNPGGVGIITSVFDGPDGEQIGYPNDPIFGGPLQPPGPPEDPNAPPDGGYEYLIPGGNVINIPENPDWPYDPNNPIGISTEIKFNPPSPGFDPDQPGDGTIGGDTGDGDGTDGTPIDRIITEDVVGCLDTITVLSTGFGYSQDDVITTIPEFPGLELEGQYTQYGQLVNVLVKGRSCGFTDIPEIRINSKTGAGADLRAQLTFITLEDFNNSDGSDDLLIEREEQLRTGGPLQIVKCVI